MSSPTANLAEYVWGPGFVGFIICLGLYGATLAQTIFYFKTFPNDRKYLIFLVTSLFVLDTFHVCCLCSGFWLFLVLGKLDNTLLLVLPWTVLASVIVTYFVTFVVQMFYCYRVWQISHGNRILTSIIAITALMQLGAGMAFGGHEIVTKTSGAIFDNQSGSVELASSVVCDILITGSLLYYFHHNKTGVKNTDAMLRRMSMVTVEMGLLGCVAAFIGLVLFFLTRGTFLCVAAHFVLSKCYVNSLLATLNSRIGLRTLADKDVQFSLSTLQAGQIPEHKQRDSGSLQTGENDSRSQV